MERRNIGGLQDKSIKISTMHDGFGPITDRLSSFALLSRRSDKARDNAERRDHD